MTLLLTAFGPFDGRSENASSIALRELKKSHPHVRTRILPVDSVVAPARLRQALRLIRPDALVMLGEAAGSKAIRLETTGWNLLDFRIPDIAGRQPVEKVIRKRAAESMSSGLPLERIHALLEKAEHEVAFSDDPGRYLCNQVFYTALDWIGREKSGCKAGFIHLPLAADYPTPRAVHALTLLLEEVVRGLEESVVTEKKQAEA